MKRLLALLSMLLLLQRTLVGAGHACDVARDGGGAGGQGAMHHPVGHGTAAPRATAPSHDDADAHDCCRGGHDDSPCAARHGGGRCAPAGGCTALTLLAPVENARLARAAGGEVVARTPRAPPSPVLVPELPPPRL